MKKLKNAFTLVEMIATIAIISVITLLATITYSKVRSNVLNKEYKNLKTLIENAAVKYSSKNGYFGFFVQELIDDNLIDPDDDKYVYDPRNKKPLNCNLVQVDVDKYGNYKATMGDKSYQNDRGCDIKKVDVYQSKLKLLANVTLTDPKVNYLNPTNYGTKITDQVTDNLYQNVNIAIVHNEVWTNKQLDLEALLTADYDQGPNQTSFVGARYIWNKNENTTTYHPERTFTTNEHEFYDDLYYLDVYTQSEEHFQARFHYRYDLQKPVIYGDKTRYADPLEEDEWKNSKKVAFVVTDKNGVGIDRVYVGSRPCTDLLKTFSRDDGNGGTEYYQIGAPAINGIIQTYTIDDIESGPNGENGEVNVCAVDRLGNLAEPEKFKVKKIDITGPQCAETLGEHDHYQYEPRTIKQYCQDNNVINGKTIIGSQCTQDVYIDTWDTTTTVGNIVIIDKAGNETECPVNVYVDRTPPVCGTRSGEGSTTNWTKPSRTVQQRCSDEHAGCRSNPVSQTWTMPEEEVLTTSTIDIYDNVPRCSQYASDGYCVNYNTIKNTDDNLTSMNNKTTCDNVGVYIDYLKPNVALRQTSGGQGTAPTVYCEDSDSGVSSLSATCNGNTVSNTTGSNLSVGTLSIPGTYDVSATCTDKAGNVETQNFTYTVTPTIYNVNLNGNGATSTNHSTSTTVAYYDTKMGSITRPQKEVLITYDLNSTGATITWNSNNNNILNTNTAKYSYTFDGWYSAASDGTIVADNSEAPNLQSASGYTDSKKQWTKTTTPTTLYAHWNSVKATLPKLTKTGYTCVWTTDNGASTVAATGSGTWSFSSANSRTFTASCTENTCTINYSPNGGSFTSNASNTTQQIKYSGSTGDMRNASGGYYSAVYSGYNIVSGAEWVRDGVTYNQANSYTASQVCPNITTRDETVTLNVNWNANMNCPTVTATNWDGTSYTKNTWTNQTIKLTINFSGSNASKYDFYDSIDNGGWNLASSNNSLSTTTQGLSASGVRKAKIVLKDANNVTKECVYDGYKVDKEKPSNPTAELRYDSSTGPIRTNTNSWTNRSLWWGNFKATDAHSGVDHYEYSGDCSTSAGNLSSYLYSGNAYNYAHCLRSVDAVGNVSNWSGPFYIKVDKVAPGLTVEVYKRASDTDGNYSTANTTGSRLGTADGGTSGTPLLDNTVLSGQVGGWLNKANFPYGVRYRIYQNDNLSGVKTIAWRYNDTGLTTSSSNYKSLPDTPQASYSPGSAIYVSFSGQGARWGKVTVEDNAGNKSFLYVNPKIDRAAPSVPTSVVRYDSSSGSTRSNGDTSWTGKTLWWGSFSSTDNLAGVDHYEYSTNCSGSKSNNLNSSYTYSNTTNYKFCIRGVDKAGNIGSWSGATYIKVDKTPPTLTVKAYKCDSSGNAGTLVKTTSGGYNTDNNYTPIQKSTDLDNANSGWLNASTFPYGVCYVFDYSDANSGISTNTSNNDLKAGAWRYNASDVYTLSTTWKTTEYKTNTSQFKASLTGQGYRFGKYTVQDAVGNKAWVYVEAMMDRTKPTCTMTHSPNSSGSCSTSGVTVTVKCADGGSGCSSAASTSYSGIKQSNNTTYAKTVKDKAGNEQSCSNTIHKKVKSISYGSTWSYYGMYTDTTQTNCTSKDDGSETTNYIYLNCRTGNLPSVCSGSGKCSSSQPTTAGCCVTRSKTKTYCWY